MLILLIHHVELFYNNYYYKRLLPFGRIISCNNSVKIRITYYMYDRQVRKY